MGPFLIAARCPAPDGPDALVPRPFHGNRPTLQHRGSAPYAGRVSTPHPIPSVRPALPVAPAPRRRSGSGSGIAAFVSSLVAAFFAIVFWAVSLAYVAADTDAGRTVAVVVLAFCAFLGLVFVALAAVFAVLGMLRNAQIGVVFAVLGAVVGAASLTIAVLVLVWAF